jgi:peptidoglycan/xylan/chitin deacetylase (PgdA/CDA1 family)
MSNLWSSNVPPKFWLCNPDLDEDLWRSAIRKSVLHLGLKGNIEDPDELMKMTLGEGRFGPSHWDLGQMKRIYYLVKPFLPRSLTRFMRQHYSNPADKKSRINWPIDSSYVLFQWEVMRQLLVATGNRTITYKSIWPDDYRFAFVLTHDIETAEGQSFVREVAEMEESMGFRSSFNFVLERYPLDFALMKELRDRDFEVGCHGLKHDGKLYNSKATFAKNAAKLNTYLKKYEMVGFRSPLTHRNPDWMQMLEIEYDSSFFDTDPFEPIPGGTMCIWPFFLGHFVELPYTLVQDYTLTSVLGETTPRIWLDKVEFIKEYRGMALLNTHPDYLKKPDVMIIYEEFLRSMKKSGGYWHALPCNISNWWKARSMSSGVTKSYAYVNTATFNHNKADY